jgi:pimeloyl-ACP methyl ester carboxylesterase
MASPRFPLVLLPGLANDARLWEHQIAGLADLAQPHVGNLTQFDTIPALATQVLRDVEPREFVLVGFSMGGYTALEIVRQAAHRVRALALVDTSARPDSPEATARRREQIDRASTDFAGVVDALFRAVVHPARRDDPALLDVFRAMARRTGAEAFMRQQRAIMSRADSRPLLASIACPTLVVCGREDPVVPVELHEELAAGIAGAELVVLGECGHLAPLERPIDLTAVLRAFVARLPES